MTQDSQDEMEVVESGSQDVETGDLDGEGEIKTGGFVETSRGTLSRAMSIGGVAEIFTYKELTRCVYVGPKQGGGCTEINFHGRPSKNRTYGTHKKLSISTFLWPPLMSKT